MSYVERLMQQAEQRFSNSEKITATTMAPSSDVSPWQSEIASLRRARFADGRFDRNKPEEREAYEALVRRAMNKGEAGFEKANSDLAQYRVFELTNDVLATQWASSFFQQVDLSANELPMIVRPMPFNTNKFGITMYSDGGGPTLGQWTSTRSAEQIELERISTPLVEYTIEDLNLGPISEEAAIKQRLQYEMGLAIDDRCKVALDACKTTSGLRDLLSYDPRIDKTNVPDTNYLDLTGSDPNVITIGKLKTILLHIMLCGTVGGAAQPFVIKDISLSPQNMGDPWNFVSMVSGFSGGAVQPQHVVPQQTVDSIFSTGMFTNAWGYNFAWKPNPQIAKGRMYISTTRPVGWVFTKSAMDKVYDWNPTNSMEHATRNRGEIQWSKVHKIVVPDMFKSAVLIVDF